MGMELWESAAGCGGCRQVGSAMTGGKLLRYVRSYDQTSRS